MDNFDLEFEIDGFVAFVKAEREFDPVNVPKVRNRGARFQATLKEHLPRATDTYVKRFLNTIYGSLSADDSEYEPSVRAIDTAVVELKMELSEFMHDGESKPRHRSDEEVAEDPVDSDNAAKLLAGWRTLSLQYKTTVTSRKIALFRDAPIVSMMAFRADKLDRAGINHTDLGGYTVLLGRTVLGISVEAINRQVELAVEQNVGEGAAINRKSSDDSINTATLAAQQSIAQTLLRGFLRRNPSMREVTPDPRVWNGAFWFWVELKPTVSRISTSGFGSGPKNLSKWGFAFESRPTILQLKRGLT